MDLLNLARRLTEDVRGKRVLIFGDVMADEFLYGSVSRISPEAPVPVLDYRDHSTVPGGAGNAAANVTALGGEALLCTVVGTDTAADDLLAALGTAGVSTGHVVALADRRTTHKMRVIAHTQHVVRIDREDRVPLDTAAEQTLRDALGPLVDDADAVIISDYHKGVVSDDLARWLVDAARAAGTPVVVDTKRPDPGCFTGATTVTPNAGEVRSMATALGLTADPDALDALEAARSVRDALELAGIVLTRSEEGMSVLLGDAERHFRALSSQVHDVTGAGDTVASAVALALAAGHPLDEAARFANAAAACVVRKIGTATVGEAELLDFLAGHEMDDSDG